MLNLNDFLSPKPETIRPMTVTVANKDGIVYKTFDTPAGFQLERYVDALYPEFELMAFQNDHEIIVHVFQKDGWDTIEFFMGKFK